MYKQIVSVIFGCVISLQPSSALGENDLANNLSENGSQENYTGFMVEDDDGYFQPIEKITLENTKNCPDIAPGKKVTFVSDSMATADNRRVIITNNTQNENNNSIFGNNNTAPFTDREYTRDFISEDIKIAIGSQHIDKKFIVSEGQNLFGYEIIDVEEKNGQEIETIVETGQFSLIVETPKFDREKLAHLQNALEKTGSEDTELSRQIRESLRENPIAIPDSSYCDSLKRKFEYEDTNVFPNSLPGSENPIYKYDPSPDFESQNERERELIDELMERNRQEYQNDYWTQPKPSPHIEDWQRENSK